MDRIPTGVRVLATLSLFLFAPPTIAAAQDAEATTYHRWYQGLRAAAPDPDRGATVRGLSLEKDRATFHLEEGTLHLLDDVEGRTYGALFVGNGRLTLTPPITQEREHLRRMRGVESLDEPFRTAVFLFTDGTLDELSQTLSWTPTPAPSSGRKAVEEALKYLLDGDGWIHRDLAIPLLNGGRGYFHAFVGEDMGDPLLFEINPYDFEEVTLYQKAEGRGENRETLVKFHKQGDYTSGSSLPQEALDLVRAEAYDIQVTISDGLDLTATATATLTPLQDGHHWVPFSLHQDLEVDAVLAADGTPLPYARPKKSGSLWVDLAPLPPGGGPVTFRYHGDIMDRPRRLWVEMKTYTTWYPYHVYDRPASYRLSFTAPDKFSVGAVASLISETREGKTVTQVFETGTVRQVGFNVGEFDTYEVDEPLGPPLKVQVSEQAHAEINDLAFRAGYLLGEQKDMGQVVGADLSRAFAFFFDAFGPTPVDDFLATEIPYGHGQAFPGMVLLSWSTFQKTDRKGYDEMFRAHEVAHQWWGVGVRPGTYHDQWLAEGFSEFAGIWYMARARGSLQLYQDRLEESREVLLRRREKAPPLWMGSRVASSRNPEDHQAVVYGKGAWVLHMLRQLLLDHDGGSEDVFDNLMRDFYARFRGQAASTEQFMQVVEEHTGDSMGWFFRQWVYGSHIPTYRFSHKLDEQPDGTWKATVRVRQEKVPDDFQMVVPIFLDFGDAGSAVVRVVVAGPLTEVELPTLPMKPVKVEFNPFEAVLAETRTEGWKD